MAHADQPKDDKPQNELALPAGKDVKQLQELYDLMQAEGLESLELEDPNTKIRLKRPSKVPPEEAPAPSRRTPRAGSSAAHGAKSAGKTPPDLSAHQTITTPLSGVFYRASSPSSAPYVSEGSVAESGQTLCIVEAMKVMNEIKAETRCKIVKIVAENSRPVTAGQVLFQVEPA